VVLAEVNGHVEDIKVGGLRAAHANIALSQGELELDDLAVADIFSKLAVALSLVILVFMSCESLKMADFLLALVVDLRACGERSVYPGEEKKEPRQRENSPRPSPSRTWP